MPKMKVMIRADTVEIEGYVNAVGRDSRPLKDEYGYPFVEQMQPGVFAKALSQAERSNKVIDMLLNHDENHMIGSTADGLELEEDTIGLHARAVVSDPETVQAAREKRLSGWSFGFIGLDYRESHSDGISRRTITDLELVEVSVIDDRMTPIYAGTSIHARAEKGEEKVYTRAFETEVEYLEEKKPEAGEEKKPETRAEEEKKTPDPGNAPENENSNPHNYDYYKNQIELLKLG